jgi:hypothetical protein
MVAKGFTRKKIELNASSEKIRKEAREEKCWRKEKISDACGNGMNVLSGLIVTLAVSGNQVGLPWVVKQQATVQIEASQVVADPATPSHLTKKVSPSGKSTL